VAAPPQPGLLTNLERGKEAHRLRGRHPGRRQGRYVLKLPLTERVIVKRLDDGSLDISHPEEPDFEL
jgi:hypothetical protein